MAHFLTPVKHAIFFFALIGYLSSCRFYTAKESTNHPEFDFQEIRFQDLEPYSFSWSERDEREERLVSLEIEGIESIDQQIIFVFGYFDGVDYGRSVILKSIDAGQSWTEIMTPWGGNSVTQMFMFPDGNGWITAQWRIESPGPITLLYTTDFGETWTPSDAQFSGFGGSIEGINFFDRQKG